MKKVQSIFCAILLITFVSGCDSTSGQSGGANIPNASPTPPKLSEEVGTDIDCKNKFSGPSETLANFVSFGYRMHAENITEKCSVSAI